MSTTDFSAWYIVGAPSTITTPSGSWSSALKARLPGTFISDIQLPSFHLPPFGELMSAAEQLESLDKSSAAALSRVQSAYAATSRLPPPADLPARLARAVPTAHPTLLPDGLPVDVSLAAFTWDTVRYSPSQPLSRTVRVLGQGLAGLDNPVRTLVAGAGAAQTRLDALARVSRGPVSQQQPAAVAGESHVETTFLTSVYVVVPASRALTFPRDCESYADFVVPGTTQPIAADRECTMFRVVVFKRDADEFVRRCNDENLAVRPYVVISGGDSVDRLRSAAREAQHELLELVVASYGPLLSLRLHIAVLRCIVEAALRFGTGNAGCTTLLALPCATDAKAKQARLAIAAVLADLREAGDDQRKMYDDAADEISHNSYLPYAIGRIVLSKGEKFLSDAEYRARMTSQ